MWRKYKCCSHWMHRGGSGRTDCSGSKAKWTVSSLEPGPERTGAELVKSLWSIEIYKMSYGGVHNYIYDVYNKPNRLKMGWKVSRLWLFKKYMFHYQHNVMGERAACTKMAAMCGPSTPLAGNETSSLYIYILCIMYYHGATSTTSLHSVRNLPKKKELLQRRQLLHLASGVKQDLKINEQSIQHIKYRNKGCRNVISAFKLITILI